MKFRFKGSVAALALVGIVVFMGPAQASKALAGAGEVSSPAADHAIEIDLRTYLLDSSVRVFDDQGERMDIQELGVFSIVKFEYRYTTEGPRISSIRVLPR